MDDRQYWESNDNELIWKHIRDVYADFIVYCQLKKTDDPNASAPQMTEDTLGSIIKMSWNEGRKDIYNEALRFAQDNYDNQDFVTESLAWIAECEGKLSKAIKLMESIEGGKDLVYTDILRMKRAGKRNNLLEEFEIGKKIWQAMINDDCQDANFALQLADICNQNGDKHATLYFVKEALFIEPANTAALFHLATWEFDIELFDLCRQTLNKLLDIDSFNIPAWNQLGVVSRILNDDEGALHAFEYSLSIDPNYLPPLGYSGYIRFLHKDFKKAKETFEKLEAQNKQNNNIFDDLVTLSAPFMGFILLREHRTEEALKKFKEGMAGAHCWISLLGIIYLKTIKVKITDIHLPLARRILLDTPAGKRQDVQQLINKPDAKDPKLLDKFIEVIVHPKNDDGEFDSSIREDISQIDWNTMFNAF